MPPHLTGRLGSERGTCSPCVAHRPACVA